MDITNFELTDDRAFKIMSLYKELQTSFDSDVENMDPRTLRSHATEVMHSASAAYNSLVSQGKPVNNKNLSSLVSLFTSFIQEQSLDSPSDYLPEDNFDCIEIVTEDSPPPTPSSTSDSHVESPSTEPNFVEAVTSFPNDLTSLSDNDLRKIYSLYCSLSGQASWLESEMYVERKELETSLSSVYNTILSSLTSSADKGVKITDLKSQAKLSPEYLDVQDKYNRCSSSHRRYRSIASILDGYCVAISREWTMRSA